MTNYLGMLIVGDLNEDIWFKGINYLLLILVANIKISELLCLYVDTKIKFVVLSPHPFDDGSFLWHFLSTDPFFGLSIQVF